MPTYLVTGVAGFIGSALAHKLIKLGQSVRGVDNLSTGYRENLMVIAPKIDFREVDLLDFERVQDACTGVDYVLHQAAIPSVPRSISRPVESNRNFLGFYRLKILN